MSESLLKFRTAYLRAIAQAWCQDEFFEQLVGQPITALQRLGFSWPWKRQVDLKVISAAHSSRWLDNAWVTSPSQNEMLRLHFPLLPRMQVETSTGVSLQPLPKEFRAVALADYYSQHPELFGDDEDSPTPDVTQSGALSTTLSTRIGLDSAAPAGGFIPPHDSFESFGVVAMAAIALAWQSDEYRQILELDSAAALNKVREFKLPWRFRLVIVNDPDTYWAMPPAPDDRIKSGWYNGKNHQLTLIVPQPPRLEVQPVALAAYNAAGAAYPFTCCL